jgi:hypothetical protein
VPFLIGSLLPRAELDMRTSGLEAVCAWDGVDGTTDAAIQCGRAAVGYAITRDGHRVYACREHAGHAKAVSETGEWEWIPKPGLPLAASVHGQLHAVTFA